MAYATVNDLRDRYEQPIPDDDHTETVLGNKLAQAERLITARLRQPIADAITAGRTTGEDVVDVLCDMVLRVVRNTAGVQAQTAGPFSQSFNATVASGNLWLTRENIAQLGLKRRRSGSAEMVDDALPYVVRPRCSPEWSNAPQPDEWC
jgi:Gp19/Gp15/Gp42-like protein